MCACARAGHAGAREEFAALQKIEGARRQAALYERFACCENHNPSSTTSLFKRKKLREAKARERGKWGAAACAARDRAFEAYLDLIAPCRAGLDAGPVHNT